MQIPIMHWHHFAVLPVWATLNVAMSFTVGLAALQWSIMMIIVLKEDEFSFMHAPTICHSKLWLHSTHLWLTPA